MEPPPIKANSNTHSFLTSLIHKGGEELELLMRKVSCATFIIPTLHGRSMLQKYPELAEMHKDKSKEAPRIIFLLMLGMTDQFSEISTQEILAANVDKIVRLSFKDLNDYQLLFITRVPGVLERLPPKNLRVLCQPLLPPLDKFWSPDQLPETPFIGLNRKSLIASFERFKKFPDFFPTLPRRIIDRLLKEKRIDPEVYDHLPPILKQRIVEALTQVTESRIEIVPFGELQKIYEKTIFLVHTASSLLERDQLLFQLKALLASRKHEELEALLIQFGFFLLCTEIFPEDFLASLKFNTLNFVKFENKSFIHEGIQILNNFEKGFEGYCHLHRFSEPQLLYLFHVRVLDRAALSSLLGPFYQRRLVDKHAQIMAEKKAAYRETYCMNPQTFELWGEVKTHFLNMLGNPIRFPSYSKLFAQADQMELLPPAKKLL